MTLAQRGIEREIWKCYQRFYPGLQEPQYFIIYLVLAHMNRSLYLELA